MSRKQRVNPRIMEALEATGLPWELLDGGSHTKIVVGGYMAGILSRGKHDAQQRTTLNTIAQIRRKAQEINDGRAEESTQDARAG